MGDRDEGVSLGVGGIVDLPLQERGRCWQPIGIGKRALQQMANGSTTSDSVDGAIGIEALKDIGLQPDLNRTRWWFSAGLKTAARIAAVGTGTAQEVNGGIVVISPKGKSTVKPRDINRILNINCVPISLLGEISPR
ncbi:MAG: hypothetical protein VKI93_04795 [Synechococcus sp.]|nr:hypothetical protein [Synechococcus sp.]